MSFYCNSNHQENCPGPITSNPVIGLCEKTCVQVKKVFDACIKQFALEDYAINVCDIPRGATFISAKSKTSKGKVSNVSVDPIDNCKNLSRVKADVELPLEIAYMDCTGDKTAHAHITLHEDVILCLPEPSIIPFEIEAVVSAVVPEGKFIHCDGSTKLVADVCVTIILKVVIEVELLIPSYGYCPIPPCQEYTQEVCAGFFELPLFPKSPCCRK